MRGRRWVLSALLTALFTVLACSDREVLELEALPEDVVFAALLGLDDDGEVVAGSSFTPREGGRFELRITESGAPTHYRVFGWTAPDLVELELLSTSQPDLSPIAIAEPKGPVLPRPSFSASSARDPIAFAPDPAPPPELTTAWLPRCPAVFEDSDELLGDFQCIRKRCDFGFEQSGCRFEIDTGDCRVGPLTGNIDGRGRFDFEELGPQLDRCLDAGVPRSPASHSFDCELDGYGCHLELYAPAAEPAIEVRVAELGRPELRGEPNVVFLPPKGMLGGLAVLSDRLVVARYGASVPGILCVISEPSELLFLDKQSLNVTATATAPPCLERLTSVPSKDEFLAIFKEEGRHHLARFDREGRMLRRALLPDVTPLPEAMTTDNTPRSITVHEERVYVSFVLSDLVFAFHVDALDPVWTTEPMEALPRSDLIVTPDGIVMSDWPDRLYFIDPGDGTFVRATNITQICRASLFVPSNMVYDPTRGRYLLLNNDPSAEVYALNADRSSCESAVFFEGQGEAFAAAPLSPEDRALMVGLWSSEGGEAFLSLLDLDPVRFRPGSVRWPAGGPPWNMVYDGGVVFGLVPPSGQVFRATLRPEG